MNKAVAKIERERELERSNGLRRVELVLPEWVNRFLAFGHAGCVLTEELESYSKNEYGKATEWAAAQWPTVVRYASRKPRKCFVVKNESGRLSVFERLGEGQ